MGRALFLSRARRERYSEIMNLEQLGWDAFFEPHVAEGYTVGRVYVEHQHIYGVYAAAAEFLARVAGEYRHRAKHAADFPAVGDWVLMKPGPEEDRATIHAVLPRKSKFSRKVAGRNAKQQIIAANVDTVFLVSALTSELNIGRIERYLAIARQSGATPVVVLNKCDLI